MIDGELDPSEVKRGERLVEHLSDAILHPVGSKYSAFGIWEPVELVVRDRLYLDDVFIRTSVRKKEMTVEFTVRNLTDKSQSAVLSAMTEDFDLGKTTVEVPAKGEKTVTLGKPWPDAKLWSPKEPHLYTLDIALTQDGTMLEHRRERFGFREFWIEGTQFVLNGIPMTFLGTSKHPSGTLAKELSKDSAFDLYRRIRTANCNAIRLHANLWPKHWFDAADEDGMPLILESGLWCFSKQYALSKDAFWKNYDRHLRGMIKKYRNHPAIMMISLENEILHCGGERYYKDCEARLADAGRKFKKLDPTRPIMYDGDEDPGGVADVINLHYPIDFKKDTLWPQVCWWLDEGKEVAGWPRKSWKWDRKKPLYMGEFLHLQQFQTAEPYSLLGQVIGDAFNETMAWCKARAWEMQIPAYRAQGVSGMCPWVVTESGPFPVDDMRRNPRFFAVKRGYAPIAAFERNIGAGFRFDTCECYSNRPIRRTMDVFNDTDRPRTLTFRWTLEAAEPPYSHEPIPDAELPRGVFHEEKKEVSLPPAGHQVIPIEIDFAKIQKEAPKELAEYFREAGYVHLVLKWELLDEKGKRCRPTGVYRENKEEFRVRRAPSRATWQPKLRRKLGVFEGENRGLSRFLGEMGVPLQTVGTLSDLGDVETLLIGPDALRTPETDSESPIVGASDSPAELLKAFLARGGRAVLLRHEPFPRGLLPVTLIDAPTAEVHDYSPLYWDKSSMEIGPIANSVYSLPSEGGAIPQGRVGGPTGYDRTPALIWFCGEGMLATLQHRLIENLNKTPKAFDVLDDALSLADEVPGTEYSVMDRQIPTSKPGLVAENLPLARRLRDVGALYDDLSGRLSGTDLSDYRVLLVEADADEVAENVEVLRGFTNRGGTLVLHGPIRDHLDKLQPLFPEKIHIQPNRERLSTYGPRTCGWRLFDFQNDDFTWYGDRRGLSWRARTPLADDVAPFVTIPGKQLETNPPTKEDDPTAEILKPVDIPASELKPVEGNPAFRQGMVAMSRRSSVRLDWVCPRTEDGYPKWRTSLLTVTAKGTPTDGEWPMLRVSIDGEHLGEHIGTLVVDKETWCERSVIVEAVGNRRIEFEFINDAWNPEKGEDRNVWIKSVRMTPWSLYCGTPVCDPAALIKYEVGKGLLFLDQINWTAPKQPTAKADRYLSLLLANLGVAFENPLGALSIPGAEFETVGKEVSRGGSSGIRHMWANGKVQKKIRFGSDGTYRFSIRASGTPLEGVYPEFRLWIDDKAVETFRLEDEKPTTLRGYIPVTTGEHRVGIEFVNDKSSETEDRNLRVHEVRVAKE